MKNKKNFLLLLFSIVVSLSFSFLFFEYFWLPHQGGTIRENLLMGHIGQPNGIVDDTHINSMGFTGDILAEKKPKGTLRILTLGGSVMFNRQITQRIKEKMQENFKLQIEILGGALRGHTSRGSLLKIKLLKKYNFDFVLIYEGINDLWANNVVPDKFQEDYSHLGPWNYRNFLLDHSLILRKIYNAWVLKGATEIEDPFHPDSQDENLAKFSADKSFTKKLYEILKETKNSGGIPILMTFAWSIPENYTLEKFKNKMVGYNNPNNYDAQPVELWGSPFYVREGLERYNAIIREVAKNTGTLLIDQEKLMGKDLFWFGDVCHFSEEGTEKFIKNIVEFFKENQLISNRPSEECMNIPLI